MVGDWNGDGYDDLAGGTPKGTFFCMDLNGNGTWDPVAGGESVRTSGRPIVGDWDGDGADEIGVYPRSGGLWYVDGVTGTDPWIRVPGRKFVGGVAGDWNGDGNDDVLGLRRNGRAFYLDVSGNGEWTGSSAPRFLTSGGNTPVAGNWAPLTPK